MILPYTDEEVGESFCRTFSSLFEASHKHIVLHPPKNGASNAQEKCLETSLPECTKKSRILIDDSAMKVCKYYIKLCKICDILQYGRILGHY